MCNDIIYAIIHNLLQVI